MGLDMFAHKVKKENVIDDLHFASSKENKFEELHYWRKHHDLHGLMEQIYREKGGTGEFNCEPVRLEERDLARIENTVKNGDLPDTTGFFFGSNPPDDDSAHDDLEFVAKAREVIKEGFAVYYDSWW